MSSAAGPEPITTLVRVRPGERGVTDAIKFDGSTVSVLDGDVVTKKVRCAQVYDGSVSTPESIASSHLQPLVREQLAGVPAVFLTLGAEGSGKSHTMDGRAGIFHLALRYLFTEVENAKNLNRGFGGAGAGARGSVAAAGGGGGGRFVVRMSFFEICEEAIRDLLQEDARSLSDDLQLGESLECGVMVENCTSLRLDSLAHASLRLDQAHQRRYCVVTPASAVVPRITTCLRLE